MAIDVEKTFCVVELNKDRGPAVWGIGESEEEAIEEAVKWSSAFSMHHSDYDIDDADDLLNDPRFHVYPCSLKLYRKVEECGGEIDFIIEKGRVVLPKEIKVETVDEIQERKMCTVFCEKHGQWHMHDLHGCPICMDERFAGLPRTPLGPSHVVEELLPNKMYGKTPGILVDEKGKNKIPEQLSLF